MSRRQGEIPVRMTKLDAAATAAWIIQCCIPMREERADTVLTPGYNIQLVGSLRELATKLNKISRRARQNRSSQTFTVNLSRQLVTAFISASSLHSFPGSGWALPWSGIRRSPPIGVRRTFIRMRVAAKLRRGRRELLPDQQAARLEGQFSVCLRQRQKLDLQKRLAEAQAAWSARVRERGETVLTTSLPPPGKLPELSSSR